MADARNGPSFLLDERLRDHHKQAALAQRTRSTTGRRSTAGRDDVFGSDADGSLYRNSPAAPSSWKAYERDAVNGRRSSGGTTPTASSAGTREDNEKIDKLTKKNFDLKLAIHFQQTKIEELEKTVAVLPQLEADHAELLEMNESMVRELELRDRAVDEAVVRIFDLEQRNQELDQSLTAARRSRRPSATIKEALNQQRRQEAIETPWTAKSERPSRASVSPEVSARMAKLAQHSDGDEARPSLPSFLGSKDVSTAALRRIFVQGNKVVRPIPSHATLLNDCDDDEALEDPHDILKSPGLSEMSDTDFRSIHEASPVNDVKQALRKSPLLETDVSTQGKEARINKWVADRAVTPTKQHRPVRQRRREGSDYPSFEQVLQPARPNAVLPARTNSQRHVHVLHESSKGGHTPPMTNNSLFGPNLFPPTPDTMITRPSNHSTSSFPPDYHTQEAPFPPPDQQQSLDIGQNPFSTSRLSIKQSRASSFLPQEFDSYDRGVESDMFRRPLYRSDSSDTSPETPRRRRQWKSASLAGSTMIDTESTRGLPPPRNSHSPSRTFESRSFAQRDPASFNEQASSGKQLDRFTRPSANQFNRTRSASSRSTQPGYTSSNSLTESPSQPTKAIDSGIPFVSPASKTTDPAPLSPSSGHSPERRQSRSEAFKRRFNRFARRNSVTASTSIDEAAQQPTSGKRQNSITQRLRLGRDSSVTADNTPIRSATTTGTSAPQAHPPLSPQTQPPSQTPISPPRRAASTRNPRPRPPPASTPSSISIPLRMQGMSPSASASAVEIDEFGVMRPTPGQNRTRGNSRGSAPGTPQVQTATVSFPSRGREGSIGGRARGVLRSLSRSRGV